MNCNPALRQYYAERALEYERVYTKPERQADLALLRNEVAEFSRGRHLLEIASGTGYWTQSAATTAKQILATDATSETLEVARAKQWPPGRVQFQIVDAYELEHVSGAFDAALAGFWWSHVLVHDLPRFLNGLHDRLEAGSRVMLFDSRFVEGSNHPISRTDAGGNTYQMRTLDNGVQHEVLKNFPTASAVQKALIDSRAIDVDVREMEYFWISQYSV